MNFINRPEGIPPESAGARLVRGTVRTTRSSTIALIDARTLERECFVRTMELTNPKLTVVGYSTFAEWKSRSGGSELASVVLYSIGARPASSEAVCSELRQLVEEARPTAVVVLAESEDLRDMIAAVDSGARGYVPASVGVDAMVHATRLASAGGVFLPVATVMSLRNTIGARDDQLTGIDQRFTSRQAAVAEALRRGKANKIIAYELNMCESTVKVHIRNIMKRLKATNRTEAAFKLNSMALRSDNAAE
jgi:DNA-binding NarL/FixJ family response regulator